MRPLTDLGKEEVEAMARVLAQLGVKPDAILTSPLVRARETAEVVAAELRVAKPAVSDELAPEGSLSGVLNDILNAGRPKQVLLSGHMPGVGRMVGYLVWAEPEAVVPFRTAAICRVDLPDDSPFPGYGDLRWLLPPRTAGRLTRR
jgi:phosphohistidine phosphatase